MNKIALALVLTLLVSLNFTACTKTKSKTLTPNNTEETTRTHSSFPVTRRNPDSVVCLNCRATFKLSYATQKQSHGHTYIECPICHHNYLKKAK